MLPVLDAAGVDLVAVSIGTASRASDFVAETGSPSNRLFADPDAACYDALRLNRSLANFSQKSTPESLARRWREDGAKDLLDVLRRWKPWIPPKPEQGFQQGGAFVFEGEQLLFQHYDPSTGAHADLDVLLQAALAGEVAQAR